jgi:S-formylglutathione hydrolase FrmB
LGANPSDDVVRLFSNKLQVQFYEALRHAGVPVEARLFEKGQHRFL